MLQVPTSIGCDSMQTHGEFRRPEVERSSLPFCLSGERHSCWWMVGWGKPVHHHRLFLCASSNLFSAAVSRSACRTLTVIRYTRSVALRVRHVGVSTWRELRHLLIPASMRLDEEGTGTGLQSELGLCGERYHLACGVHLMRLTPRCPSELYQVGVLLYAALHCQDHPQEVHPGQSDGSLLISLGCAILPPFSCKDQRAMHRRRNASDTYPGYQIYIVTPTKAGLVDLG